MPLSSLLLTGWEYRLAAAGIALALATLVARAARWRMDRLASRPAGGTRELTRLRRHETALVVAATALRYLLFLAAAFAFLGAFVRNTAAAFGGAAFVGVVVAFAFQRLLFDLVAGSLALFEAWYGVGDFVTLQPMGVSGFVEEFGLRTTVIRSLNGDRSYVPNGQINAVVRAPQGYRRYSVELLTCDADAARRAVEHAAQLRPSGEARFLRPPYVTETQEVSDGVWRVRAECDVPPTMEWLAESLLPSRLRAELDGDNLLLADPIVYTLDETALTRYERRVLLP